MKTNKKIPNPNLHWHIEYNLFIQRKIDGNRESIKEFEHFLCISSFFPCAMMIEQYNQKKLWAFAGYADLISERKRLFYFMPTWYSNEDKPVSED